MIIIFPMLVSQAVSENSIPAIAKTIEIYLIGNATDKIINHPDLEKYANLNYKIKKGRIIAEQGGPPGSTGGTKGKGPSGSGGATSLADYFKKQQDKIDSLESEISRLERKVKDAKDLKAIEDKKLELQARKQDFEEKKRAEEKAEKEAEKKAERASAKITTSDYKSISLEPTTITVEVKKGNREIKQYIGIKVLPLRIKSDARLSHLILHDYQLNFLKAKIISIGRATMRFIWKMTDRWAKRLRIDDLTPTGDPRQDVLMGRSGHTGTAFVVLSKTEDIDEYFLSNYKKLRRLSKMGWGNFIIADDVNRLAYFCMEEYKGVCNVISYEMMYNNLGQLKVYESLEDAKKKSSSLFKIKRRFSRVMGEWIVHDKLTKYSNLRED